MHSSVDRTREHPEVFRIYVDGALARFPESFRQRMVGQLRPDELVDLVRQGLVGHMTRVNDLTGDCSAAPTETRE